MSNCNYWFFPHKWSQWKTKEQGSVLATVNKAVIGFYTVQERTCQDCGKVEINKQQEMIYD